MEPDYLTITVGNGQTRRIPVEHDRPRTPVDTPGQALTCRLRAIDWLTTPAAAYAITRAGSVTLPDNRHPGEMLADVLTAADTIYATADMGRLAWTLAQHNDQPAVLHRTDVPARQGILIYGNPVLLNPNLDLATTRAIVWATFDPDGRIRGPGWEYDMDGSVARYEEDRPVYWDRDRPSPMPDGGVLVWDMYDAGHYLTTRETAERFGRPPILPGYATCVPFGSAYETAADLEADHSPTGNPTPGLRTSSESAVSLFVTTLRLMWQRLTDQSEWQPTSRAELRRLTRRWPAAAGAKVIHLRRSDRVRADTSTSGTGRQLTVTTIVRGHWRDQYYRTLGPARTPDGQHNPGSHRRIWIDAHVRGDGLTEPADRPNLTVVRR